MVMGCDTCGNTQNPQSFPCNNCTRLGYLKGVGLRDHYTPDLYRKVERLDHTSLGYKTQKMRKIKEFVLLISTPTSFTLCVAITLIIYGRLINGQYRSVLYRYVD